MDNNMEELRAYELTVENLRAERDELLAVLKKVAAWNKVYPSSRIYGHEAIKRIAAEMDAINAEAKAAIAKAEGGAG